MKPQVNMVGNLTADVTHVFQNDDGSHKRVLFTVACNSTHTKDGKKIKSVEFIPCIAWNGLADMLQEWGLKGRKVNIVGTLEAYQPSANDDGEYPPTKVQVRAEKIEFCALEDSVKAKLGAKKTEAPAQTATPAIDPAVMLEALAKLLQQLAQQPQGKEEDVAF